MFDRLRLNRTIHKAINTCSGTREQKFGLRKKAFGCDQESVENACTAQLTDDGLLAAEYDEPPVAGLPPQAADWAAIFAKVLEYIEKILANKPA